MNLIRKSGGLYPSFMEDIFDESWSGQGNRADTGTRVPAVNVSESDDEFEIHVAAPGMKKENFEISVDNNVLSISSEERTETGEKDKKANFTRREFSFTSFRRAFSLPDSAEQDHIDASYENGILKITVPKKEEAKPKPRRQIEIE